MKATVLMIEAEPLESLSVRKLVLETERYNVITANNAEEGLQLFRKFMKVDVVIIHANVQGSNCDEVARQIKELRPDIPVIALLPNESKLCRPADYRVSSHEPQALLNVLAKTLSSPQTSS